MSGTTSTPNPTQQGGTTTSTTSQVNIQKPSDPKMGTTEETYPGSGDFYYTFGGEPLPDWSNIKDPSTRLLSDLCFRPVDPVSGQKSSVIRTTGLKHSFSRKDKLTVFQKQVWNHLRKHGLDTVTYLQDPNDNSTCLSVVTHHARFTSDLTKAEQLSTIFKSNFDSWDKKHDYEAKSFFLSSLSTELTRGLDTYIEDEDTFAICWLKFVRYLVVTTTRTFDVMRENLRTIRPNQFEGQNIEKMAESVINTSTELDHAGHYDHNLTLSIVDAFLCASPDSKGTFHHTLNNLRAEVETLLQTTLFLPKADQDHQFATKKLTYTDVCMKASDIYKILRHDNMWEPAKLPKDNQKPAAIGLTQAQIMLLAQNLNSSNSKSSPKRSSSSKSSSYSGCFNCGSKDHMVKDCPHPLKSNDEKGKKSSSSTKQKINKRHRSMAKWKLQPPSDPNATITKNGKTYHFCTKCGNWTPTHTTATHTGFKPNPSTQAVSNLTMTDPNVWFTPIPVNDHSTNINSDLTTKLLWGYFICSIIIMITMLVKPVYPDLSLSFSYLQTVYQQHLAYYLDLFKICLAPLSWFTAGGLCHHLSLLRSKAATFNAKDYALSRPSRSVYRSYRKTHRSKPKRNKSIKDYDLHRSYPLRLRNENKFVTRRDAMLKACYKHHHHHYHHDCPTSNKALMKPQTKTHTHVPFDCKKAFSRKQWHSNAMRSWRIKRKKKTVNDLIQSRDKKPTPAGYCYVPFKKCRHIVGPPSSMNKIYFTPTQFNNIINSDKHRSFSIIWDSGASICITPDKEDFIEYSTATDIKSVRTMGGNVSSIKGQGQVLWSIHDTDGMLRHLKLNAYHIPSSTSRLLSTSSLLKAYKNETITVDDCSLTLSGLPGEPTRRSIIAYNDPVTLLPTTTGYKYNDIEIPSQKLANVVHTVHTDNKNLTEAEKELLRWHYRLGHLSFRKIQHLMKTGALSHTSSTRTLHTAASKISTPPKCAACLFGKQVARSSPGKTTTVVKDRAGVLRDGNLLPGAEISVDHFISSVKGRLFTGYDKGSDDSRYVGGCIFVDHSSNYTHIEFQSSLSSHDTLRAKTSFEKVCRDYGVVPKTYMSDNGSAFTSRDFTEHLSNYHQISKFAGVGAHHHNAIAERSIRTIMSIARTMMMHAAIHWPDMAKTTLWPMAVSHACFLWNHVPDPSNGLSPHDIFVRSRWPTRRFHDLHVWGCPTYVLDKAIQDGRKIPRWKPRSDRMLYMGTSRYHASTVPLVLNTSTGYISPQFHVVFDDWFATVGSSDEETPDFQSKEWLSMFGSSRFQYVLEDHEDLCDDDLDPQSKHHLSRQDDIDYQQSTYAPSTPLSTYTMPPAQLERGNQHQQQFKSSQSPAPSSSPTPVPYTSSSQSPPPAPPLSPSDNPSSSVPSNIDPTPSFSPTDDPTSTPPPSPTNTPTKRQRKHQAPQRKQHVSQRKLRSATTRPTRSTGPVERLTYTHDKRSLTHSANSIQLPSPQKHCFLTCFPVAYYCDRLLTSLTDCLPIFKATKSNNNPDIFTFEEAMQSEYKQEFMKAALDEVRALEALDCWEEVPLRQATTRVIPGTWAFRIKRTPDGTIKKFKARYCIRGDLQEGEFETYAPVVHLSSVRLFLAWSLILGWTTCCIDFSNAFVQAKLDAPTFIHLPQGFTTNLNKRTCLKLKRSLYGLSVAPRLWFQHLWKALEAEGLKQCSHDPCLLFKSDLIVIQYVDDLGIAGPSMESIDNLIENLKKRGFELTKEGTFSEYLGIQYTTQDDGSILMNQPGLIQKIIDATQLTNCNPNRTPTTKEALPLDPEGPRMTDTWNYQSIVGMLLYLSTNTRPDIAFAVSQVARFSHNPKQSHATAVKTIIRYLAGSKNEGTIFKPPKKLFLDCFVDADYAGLYNRDPPEEPTSAKSRTGYIISIAGCYLLCKSQLQSTIALSTSEAEYGALSQAMRVLLPIRETILELIDNIDLVDAKGKQLLGDKESLLKFKTTIYEDNATALALATTQKVTSRTKHWCVKWHFFWSHLNDKDKNIECVKVASQDQRADYLTKGLTKDAYCHCRFLNQGW